LEISKIQDLGYHEYKGNEQFEFETYESTLLDEQFYEAFIIRDRDPYEVLVGTDEFHPNYYCIGCLADFNFYFLEVVMPACFNKNEEGKNSHQFVRVSMPEEKYWRKIKI